MRNKLLLLGICIILLLPFIYSAPSEIEGLPIYSTHTENNIIVNWYEIGAGMTHKEYIYSIKLIDGSPIDINMIPFIDNAEPSVYEIIGFAVDEYEEKTK